MHLRRLFCLALALIGLGCGSAEIDNMVAGGNVGNGRLECWLELVFDEVPSGIDAHDVTVRFSGEALDREAEFDWEYIAARDVTKGKKFGSGNSPNDATTPENPPPPGATIKVRFPLEARRELLTLDSQIWVEADLYWGGKHQDSARRDVSRLWQDAAATQANPWSM